MKDLKHWANNCAGIVLVSVLFIVVTLAAGRLSGGTATGTLVTLFSLIGLAALGVWAWIAFSTGSDTADKIMRPR